MKCWITSPSAADAHPDSAIGHPLAAALRRCRDLEKILGSSPLWQFEMAQLLLQAGRSEEASALLRQAEEQLGQLRETPARRALRSRIRQFMSINPGSGAMYPAEF